MNVTSPGIQNALALEVHWRPTPSAHRSRIHHPILRSNDGSPARLAQNSDLAGASIGHLPDFLVRLLLGASRAGGFLVSRIPIRSSNHVFKGSAAGNETLEEGHWSRGHDFASLSMLLFRAELRSDEITRQSSVSFSCRQIQYVVQY